MNYDIIGDIHGHAEALEMLLAQMGYRQREGAWRHPDRTAVFVGDFIDRGPQQVRTVDIVRRMVDARSARAIMGNHEFNAIAWFLEDPHEPGEYLRRHHSPKYGDKNRKQHQAFLDEVEDTPKHEEIVSWFLELPLWLDLVGIRVVHACWHSRLIEYLTPRLAEGNRLTRELMLEAAREPDDEREKDEPGATVFKSVEALTKGIEIPLPGQHRFSDKDGHERRRVRTRWWDLAATTYRTAAMADDALRRALPDGPIPVHALVDVPSDKPTFIGHYWLTGTPTLLWDTVACIDYSVAKGGKLVAYRWQGEPMLDVKNFYWARS